MQRLRELAKIKRFGEFLALFIIAIGITWIGLELALIDVLKRLDHLFWEHIDGLYLVGFCLLMIWIFYERLRK